MRGKLPHCRRGSRVTLMSKAFVRVHQFAGVPAVYAKVRTRHRYRVRARIKRGLKPGRYKVTGRCGGGNLGVSVSLRVRR